MLSGDRRRRLCRQCSEASKRKVRAHSLSVTAFESFNDVRQHRTIMSRQVAQRQRDSVKGCEYEPIRPSSKRLSRDCSSQDHRRKYKTKLGRSCPHTTLNEAIISAREMECPKLLCYFLRTLGFFVNGITGRFISLSTSRNTQGSQISRTSRHCWGVRVGYQGGTPFC